jgi:hypothetical protein
MAVIPPYTAYMIRLVAFTAILLPALASAQVITLGRNPSDMKFNANGKILAVSCDDHIYVRDLEHSRNFRFPTGELCDISPGGTRLMIRDVEKEHLTVWDVATSQPIRVWPHATAGATFSSDGRQAIFFSGKDSEGLSRSASMPLVALNIRSGKYKTLDRWSLPVSKFMADWFSHNGFKTEPQDIRFAAVYGSSIKWRADGLIQAAVSVSSPRALVYAVFTTDVQNHYTKWILPGFGLYFLWNGDYLWKDFDQRRGKEPEEWFAVWHGGKSRMVLDVPDFVTEPAPSGDAGSYAGVCTTDTPWVAFYGIRNIAEGVDGERYSAKKLRRQRLIVELVNARTGRKEVVVNRRYLRLYVVAAVSADASRIAYISPTRQNQVVLQTVKV